LLERYIAFEKMLKIQANSLYHQHFGGLFE
jgi:hypothetical protein